MVIYLSQVPSTEIMFMPTQFYLWHSYLSCNHEWFNENEVELQHIEESRLQGALPETTENFQC